MTETELTDVGINLCAAWLEVRKPFWRARLPIPDSFASETNDRRLQQPRVFYRREPERDPFVVARRTDG